MAQSKYLKVKDSQQPHRPRQIYPPLASPFEGHTKRLESEMRTLHLQNSEVTVSLSAVLRADYAKRYCPTHSFDILVDNVVVGAIRFRIGQSKHLLYYSGQIAYGIEAPYRGNRYATQALLAVLPHCFEYFPKIYVTCDPDNVASRRTIEAVSHEFLGLVEVPKNNPMYREGHRKKRRYVLMP